MFHRWRSFWSYKVKGVWCSRFRFSSIEINTNTRYWRILIRLTFFSDVCFRNCLTKENTVQKLIVLKELSVDFLFQYSTLLLSFCTFLLQMTQWNLNFAVPLLRYVYVCLTSVYSLVLIRWVCSVRIHSNRLLVSTQVPVGPSIYSMRLVFNASSLCIPNQWRFLGVFISDDRRSSISLSMFYSFVREKFSFSSILLWISNISVNVCFLNFGSILLDNESFLR